MALYDEIGVGYANRRQPDPRIAAAIVDALGDARSVINVGAGAGSYEPTDRAVLAVEPSDLMISQRLPNAARCIRGVAEALPVESKAFDAAMAILTIHHWTDWRAGMAELRRVARSRIVLLTFDPDAPHFWLTARYFPELAALDHQIMPPIDAIAATLGPIDVAPVPVPHDCVDGFLCAYWRRPSAYLDADVRRCMSSFSQINSDQGLKRLADDLESGRWHDENAGLIDLEALDVGYCLVRAEF